MSKLIHPLRIFLHFFRWFRHPDCVEDIAGDLLERFEEKVERKGVRTARVSDMSEPID